MATVLVVEDDEYMRHVLQWCMYSSSLRPHGRTGLRKVVRKKANRHITTWQQLVIIFEMAYPVGREPGRVRYPVDTEGPGRVRYPEDLAGQEINAVLDQYGRQGYEVVHLGVNEGTGVIVLKKSG